MAYSRTSYSVGDIVKVTGNGPASEEGVIIFIGESFLTYRGPYYNKTISAFEITSGKVTITVTDHNDDVDAAIEQIDQSNSVESFTSGWITPSIFAGVADEPEEETEIDFSSDDDEE